MGNVHSYLKWGAFAGACLLGIFLIFLNLFSCGSDQISYLDMAHVFAQGSWWQGINGYWSPLLPALLALAFRIAHPTLAQELPLAEMVIYFDYVFVLAAYLFFHARLVRCLASRFPLEWTPAKSSALFLFGFSAVFAASFRLLGYGILADLLVVAFFLMSCGFLAGFLCLETTIASISGFALMLALGSLSKSVFFVLALVFILTFYGSQRRKPRALFNTGLLTVLFLIFTSILWLPLSISKGHFTFGDSGKINYVWFMAQGRYAAAGAGLQTSLDGTPLQHPVQILSQDPLVYGFKGNVGGTFPNWYDPSYWMEGLHIAVRPVRQAVVVFLNVLFLIDAATGGSGPGADILPGANPGVSFSLIAFLSILAVAGSYRETIRRTPWRLLVPSLAGLAVYGLSFVTYRYVVGFILVLMLACAGEALARLEQDYLRVARRIALILFVITFVTLVGQSLNGFHDRLRQGGWRGFLHNPEVAGGLALHALGVPEGTPIATIGDLATSYMPEAARVRVLGRLVDEKAFWQLSEVQRQRIYALFSSHGMDAVIAKAPPPRYSREGWIPIGESPYLLHQMKKTGP